MNLIRKPRLGLAISNGGARGLAHIGMLIAMEEAEIQPDYLTGTSIGGVITTSLPTKTASERIK